MIVDKEKLRLLIQSTYGWNPDACWRADPADEDNADWEVGRIDEEDNQYPILSINTDEYDQPEDAEKLARYYAAVKPKAVMALLDEITALTTERDRLRQDRDGLLESGAHLL